MTLETILRSLLKRVNLKETHRFFARNEDCDRLQEYFFVDTYLRIAYRRFRIISERVQADSRVLEMPEIRYSKRFEHLRVRVILRVHVRTCEYEMYKV